MGSETKIQWCDATFNPWRGCTKVSPGCLNCYAEARDRRFSGGAHWGKGAPRELAGKNTWREPVRWNAAAKNGGCGDCDPCLSGRPDQCTVDPIKRSRVFCASLADWLDDEVPIEWLIRLLDLIRQTPNLDWLLLTKRPETWLGRMGDAYSASDAPHPRRWIGDWVVNEDPPHNVWVGTSVEDQTRYDQRVPELLKIPARIRFLSAEPLLGPIFVGFPLMIDWVICGGESGPNARPMDIAWAENIRIGCARSTRAFFMKQLGSDPYARIDGNLVSVRNSDSKGGALEEFPELIRLRQFPTPR